MSNRESLYKNSKRKNGYMEYYESMDIPFDNDTDYLLLIEKEYEFKPGKLALKLYGSERLTWVFSYFNRDIIQDPIFDLKSGIYIRVPTNDRLQQYL
jgi:hypothetical protein